MSCGYGTLGAQCDQVYTLPGVTTARATEWFVLGQKLGLTEFNPTTVNWDAPVTWKSSDGGIMTVGTGLGMMFGFGIGLTVITCALSVLEKKFAGNKDTSEFFNTAGREVKTGLTASVIVSQWTWAATLLQSSNVAWNYGITGPFWYASGASIQVLVFGILAIEVKRRAPNAHTFLEMINIRWGKCAHFIFMFYGLSTNLIVSSMLLLGGCSVMDSVAGINKSASAFIIPSLVLLYTFYGGLKATFLASYLHTAVIFVGLILFVTYVYGIENDCTAPVCTPGECQCNSLGSASLMWERLRFVTALPTRVGDVTFGNTTVGGFHQGPAHVATRSGNRQGSYLTMMSMPGLMFGIINIVGNFGTVFVDQSYWQSAIAASPASAHKGYLLGGLVWFTIPFALATSLGLASNALNVALTADDAGKGLVPPAAGIVLMGASGGFLMILMLFMAIVSTGSAECIAVSSLWSYDIYRTYINKNATGKQILLQSRIVVVVWALVMALASITLDAIGLNLGWVYNFMGIWIGSAVTPISMCVLTERLSGPVAIFAALFGQCAALTTWIVVAFTHPLCAAPNNAFLDCTGLLDAQLYGNLVAILSSFTICSIGCFTMNMKFDWNIMIEGIKLVGGDGGENSKVLGADWESRPEFLEAAKAWIFKYGLGWTAFLVIGWPTLSIPFGMFGKSTFQLWGSVALCWGWSAGLIIITLPLWENRASIIRVFMCDTSAAKETTTDAKPVTETAVA